MAVWFLPLLLGVGGGSAKAAVGTAVVAGGARFALSRALTGTALRTAGRYGARGALAGTKFAGRATWWGVRNPFKATVGIGVADYLTGGHGREALMNTLTRKFNRFVHKTLTQLFNGNSEIADKYGKYVSLGVGIVAGGLSGGVASAFLPLPSVVQAAGTLGGGAFGWAAMNSYDRDTKDLQGRGKPDKEGPDVKPLVSATTYTP